jgi:hypothetical protein
MSGKVVLSTPSADSRFGSSQRNAETEPKAAKSRPSPDDAAEADLRLIIEETGEPGGYQYTIVDRRSGKVVSRLLRDEILRLRDQANYSAGAVFDGKA